MELFKVAYAKVQIQILSSVFLYTIRLLISANILPPLTPPPSPLNSLGYFRLATFRALQQLKGVGK